MSETKKPDSEEKKTPSSNTDLKGLIDENESANTQALTNLDV
jgi:hypothetical protein